MTADEETPSEDLDGSDEPDADAAGDPQIEASSPQDPQPNKPTKLLQDMVQRGTKLRAQVIVKERHLESTLERIRVLEEQTAR